MLALFVQNLTIDLLRTELVLFQENRKLFIEKRDVKTIWKSFTVRDVPLQIKNNLENAINGKLH